MSIKIYCEVCKNYKKMGVKTERDKTYPDQGVWGDILCPDCHFVIATVSGDEPGEYELVKVGDL